MDEQEKSARLIRAEEKVKLANDKLEKVKKEEKKRMRIHITSWLDAKMLIWI